MQVIDHEDAIKIECIDVQELENYESKKDLLEEQLLHPSELTTTNDISDDHSMFLNDQSASDSGEASSGLLRLNEVSLN